MVRKLHIRFRLGGRELPGINHIIGSGVLFMWQLAGFESNQ